MVTADIGRILDKEDGILVGFESSIRVFCAECQEPLQFIGLPIGYSPRQPMVDVSGHELRAPLLMAGFEPRTEPGFHVLERTNDSTKNPSSNCSIHINEPKPCFLCMHGPRNVDR